MSQNKSKTVVSNQQKIRELAAMLSVYADVQLKPEHQGKIQNLKDRLSFTLLDLEEQGQKAKIKNMEGVLEVMKDAARSRIIV